MESNHEPDEEPLVSDQDVEPSPTVTMPPPTDKEVLSVHQLKYMLEDINVPKGFIQLFWGYISKIGALTNLTDADIERILDDYEYCRHIYQMKQKQAMAMIDPETNLPLDPIKVIDIQFKEDMALQQGKTLVFMQIKRSKDAMTMQLVGPRGIPQPPQMIPVQAPKRSMWDRFRGRE